MLFPEKERYVGYVEPFAKLCIVVTQICTLLFILIFKVA
jgi:hypothetical protein